MGKKKTRNRKKRKQKRLNETCQEMTIRLTKCRGGRGTMVINDKTKYNRKKEQHVDLDD